MTELREAGALCPIRVIEGELEVLLGRRTFWNYDKDRPFSLPGEWAFIGGSYDEEDEGLAGTAIREFREELDYDRIIRNIHFLRSGIKESFGRPTYIEFYSAGIDNEYSFTLEDDRENIDIRWFRPSDALSLILSEEFTCKQLEEFKRRGLGNSKYGIYAVTHRQLPTQNILTLEYIQQVASGLIELYK